MKLSGVVMEDKMTGDRSYTHVSTVETTVSPRADQPRPSGSQPQGEDRTSMRGFGRSYCLFFVSYSDARAEYTLVYGDGSPR